MNGAGAVEFRGVSKYFYRHAGRALLRSQVEHWFRGGARERFYALRGVSFRVGPGESVGVIGTNGAGKSTLLSLMAGLADPDEGSIALDGRLGALLQLGAGFHLDLTGVENIFLNAALMGLSRRRIAELFETVVEFAGVGEFIDEPLRTYSSGMTLRLAFSVAIHMDPDILIVDEVLAVGDHAFQAKCMERILDHRRAGKTLLCVSHAGGAVETLCERALWLDHGELVMDGPASEVLDAYEGRLPSRRP